MTTKTLLAAFVLTVAPAAAMAMGCNYGSHVKDDVAMSCAAGTVWDSEAKNCVPVTTG